MARVLVFLLLFTCLGIATAEPLPDDAALSASVTLAVKGESLADTLKLLQKQTGVQLQAARDVADQKVTIFVDDKPLRKVMEGLSVLLEYHWTAKDLGGRKVYEIWEDEKTRLARDEWFNKAAAKAWEEADAELQRKSEFAAMSEEQLNDLRQQLSAKLSMGSDSAARKDWEALLSFLNNPAIVPVARLYGKLSPQALEAFRTGMTLYFDSISDEEAWLIPDDSARVLAESSSNTMSVNGKRLVPDGVNLEICSAAGRESVSASATVALRMGNPSVPYRLPDGRESAAFSTSACMYPIPMCRRSIQEACPLPQNHLPKEDVGDRQVTWDVAEVAEEASLPGESTSESNAVANRSDILALLHRKLGLQIIADHYSEWGSWAAAKDRPLKDVRASFETMYNHANVRPCQAYSGFDGDFLYMRAKDVRACNLREIPNRLLRPWQTVYSKQGCLGLNELGEIAQLTEDQMPYTDSRLMGLGERPVTGPVLRLYGLLTPSQRKEAFSGGTSTAAFTPAQRDALITLLPTPRSSRIPSQGPIVGIYRDGWRIDKEETPPRSVNAGPVSVAMNDQVTTEQFFHEVKTKGGGSSSSAVTASSPQEAWDKIKSEHPEALKENLICVRFRVIKAIVRCADGSSSEKSVDLPSRIPYSQLEGSNEP